MEDYMKSCITVLIMLALILTVPVAKADQFLGGDGLFYTASALTYVPGKLGFALYTRSFTTPLTGTTDVTSNTAAIAAHFGVSRHIEVGGSQVVYQDLNYNLQRDSKTYMIPGYTQLHLKFANLQLQMGQNFIFYGAQVAVTKQGKYHNCFMEPYYDAGIAGQIDLLASYYWNPFYPSESQAVHLNIGYVHFNDAVKLMDSGQAIPLSLAYVNAKLRFDYSVELTGRFFVKDPYLAAYSSEDYMYLTPAFKYKLFYGLHVGAAFDVLIMEGDEKTQNYYAPFTSKDYSQYATWRLNLKVDFVPSTAFYQTPTFKKIDKELSTKEILRTRRIITDRKSLFEWVVDENKGAEYINLELEKIREERKRAEKELEQLKKEIEEKSKGK